MLPAKIVLPTDLPAEWRAQAEGLREFGADAQAKALDRCANRLEEALRQEGDALLTLPEAAEESGYSSDHIGRLIREGRIPNAGRPGAPRIARRDLPLKATQGHSAVPQHNRISDTSNAQIVQSIIEQGVG